MDELTRADILDGFAASQKSYEKPASLDGVELYPLQRFVDDRGLFMEVYRRDVTHAGSERLRSFFSGVGVAQLNYSLVNVADHIKGLHYHLKQSDIWFCPPPSKIKVVLYDIRKGSPTSGRTQVVVLGDGRDVLVGVRPEGQEPAPQLMLNVNRVKAQALGIDMADLNETLQSALGVNYINDFVRQGRVLRVQMQAEENTRRTPQDILQIPVRNNRGQIISLSEIATAKWTAGSPKLDRYNGLPSMKISGVAAPGRSTGEAMAAMAAMAQTPRRAMQNTMDIPSYGVAWPL